MQLWAIKASLEAADFSREQAILISVSLAPGTAARLPRNHPL
jgi:hypothetical protein